MEFKGFIFDFDGTITPKGVHFPTPEMVESLVDLAQVMPIACCTGRQLESFEAHGMNYLLEGIDPAKKDTFLKNMFLMGENGSVGYHFDGAGFKEFYRAQWPGEFIARQELYEVLAREIEEFGTIYDNAHRVVIVMRTHLNGMPGRSIEEVYALSEKIYHITIEVLGRYDQNFEEYLHVGNSGLGVIVCPADGDKDRGIKQFADYLNGARDYSFDPQAREILVVGDQPGREGNDHYLLNGAFGSPYTVGDLILGSDYPLPVLDEEGVRLMHDEGTRYLIQQKLLTSC